MHFLGAFDIIVAYNNCMPQYNWHILPIIGRICHVILKGLVNPLMPETFMPSNFEMKPKIGSHRLPTHRRGAHRIFFLILFFLKRNFDNTVTIVAVRQ